MPVRNELTELRTLMKKGKSTILYWIPGSLSLMSYRTQQVTPQGKEGIIGSLRIMGKQWRLQSLTVLTTGKNVVEVNFHPEGDTDDLLTDNNNLAVEANSSGLNDGFAPMGEAEDLVTRNNHESEGVNGLDSDELEVSYNIHF